MKNKIYAAVDIGTNTILMVIAMKNSDNNVEIITNEHSIARLGEGVDQTGIICEKAVRRAENILSEYRKICDKYNVTDLRVCATSAIRDAQNSSDVRKRLGSVIDAEIETISGFEEARLSFLGTVENEDETAVVIDIGGGSTEIIKSSVKNIFDDQIENRISLQTGAVRITERFLKLSPPSSNDIDAARDDIIRELKKLTFDADVATIYAVAGTPVTIASAALGLKTYDYSKVQGYILKRDILDEVFFLFKAATVDELITDYGIPPKRADLICAGTLILETILNKFNKSQCIVSAHGLRYGILKKMMIDSDNN
jgi:exopolyphosphatase/guanosine-5'-triphosphate,3'-diphosphate pyrophosphatase